ncbi:glycosyltransferase family 9 protein [Gaetbulibacter aestuarii]|uniref:Glycosyltransferase family 9 protein n=2 Tax=Gaetbulibacter aestuarii TaxID=1502358 RepID=A0ABW7N0Y3_9FLAO
MIGDVLTSSILFEALRQKYPKAQLHYLINKSTFPVVENNPFIDEFIFFTEKERRIGALLKFAFQIRHQNYDVVIDVYSKLSSNIITALSKAKTRISYFKHYSTLFYSHNIKRKTHGNQLALVNRLQLLSVLGMESDIIKPKIYLRPEEIKTQKTYLEKQGIDLKKPLYMISVLGSGENKTYPLPYMAKVIDQVVAETNGQVLFNYMPNQKEEANMVYELCKESSKAHIHLDIFGNNLRDFLAITKHCTALIGNEGGAINMAKALDVKTFAIFSPWITKETWGFFENETEHVAVHLKDFKPQLFEKAEGKKLKKEVKSMYHVFKPSYFTDALKRFLTASK